MKIAANRVCTRRNHCLKKFLVLLLSLLCFGKESSFAFIEIPFYSTFPYFTLVGGNGRSYQNGYQSVGLFTIYKCDPFDFWCNAFDQYLFLDLQLIRVDLGRYAGSYGIGWRRCKYEFCETIGVNLFYDSREYLQTLFNQVGFGLEMLSGWYEVRFNAYLPFGRTDAFQTTEYIDYGGGYYAIKSQEQSAMWGLDAEVAVNCHPWCCTTIYAGLGPYFYNTYSGCSCSSNALIGAIARGAFFWKNLKAQVLVTYDPVFKTKVQGEIVLNVIGGKCCRAYCPELQVQRNPIIITTKTCTWQTNY